MGSLSRRGFHFSSPSTARGFTPLGEVESDPIGVLIAARSEASGALVDVRVLAPTLRKDPAFMRRLGHAMDILREVRHTNLVSVMSFDKKVGAVVYEAVRGSTLSQLVAGQEPLQLAASLVLLEDTISGLEALQNAGVVHGNLTADSVVLETTGAVLLRDAGTWAPHGAGRLAEQQPYTAPEVLAGASPTPASDLYAATAVFLESVGGRASKLGMRTDLRSLLNEGMAKNPSERSATFSAFRRELDDYARATFGESWRKDGRALLITAAAAQATRAIRVSSPSDSLTESGDEAVAAVAILRSPAPRHPAMLWGAGMLGFAVLLVAVVLLRGLSAGESPTTALLSGPFNGISTLFGGHASPSPSPNAAGPPPASVTVPPGTTGPNPIIDPTSPTGPTPDPSGAPGPTPKPNPGLHSQTITFTTQRPIGATYGGSYTASAASSSGYPVVLTSLNKLVCTAGGGNTFDFVGVGTCYLQASQAGNSLYNPAANTQSFLVGKATQTITDLTSPSNPTYGGGYTVTASAVGGAVRFSADPSSVACSVSSSGAVQFTAAGQCIIDANQPGSADYAAAPQSQLPFTVAQASQTISITSNAPCNPCATPTQYQLAGTASSGLAVTFGIDSSSTPGSCSISGSVVTINGGLGVPGTCVIDWFQDGDQDYAPAGVQSQSIGVL
jgi:hypothetical protein